MESMRINKFLAHGGVCSRRDADKLIEQGRVLVNGSIARPGQLVGREDTVVVNGKTVAGQEKKVVLAYYKPVGVTCTERDAHAGKVLTKLIEYPIRVTYAGRLDKDSEGLLLLTNDGDLIQGMMRGANRHEKEYIVKTDKEVTEEFLSKMSQGLYLKDLDATTRPCETQKLGKYSFRIILTQGLNRQIRRMCAACGYEVKKLKRVRVMHVTIGSLLPGQYVELGVEDIQRLYRDCGLK